MMIVCHIFIIFAPPSAEMFCILDKCGAKIQQFLLSCNNRPSDLQKNKIFYP